jgi:hypothetical protein
MTDETDIIKSKPNHQKHKKSANTTKKVSDLADAWKFGFFAVRATISAVTGKVFGNSAVDDAMGEAFATITPPQEVCDKGKHYNILVNGMAGAWKAARGDEEWE